MIDPHSINNKETFLQDFLIILYSELLVNLEKMFPCTVTPLVCSYLQSHNSVFPSKSFRSQYK